MREGFEIFDAHMHYSAIFKPKDQTLIEFMDEQGIDRAVVNTLNTEANLGILKETSPQELMEQIRKPDFELFLDFRQAGQPDHTEVEKLAEKYPERVFPFFWYNPNDPNDPDQQRGLSILENKIDKGFMGVKIQLAMTPCPTKRLYPVAELLNERRLPLFIHPTPGLFSIPRTNVFELAELAKNFPKMPLIIGHSSYTMEFAIETLFAAFPVKNIYFETSVSIAYGIITYIKMFGTRRVLFGSDTPPSGPFKGEFEKIKVLKIPDRAKQQIFSRNLARLLRV